MPITKSTYSRHRDFVAFPGHSEVRMLRKPQSIGERLETAIEKWQFLQHLCEEHEFISPGGCVMNDCDFLSPPCSICVLHEYTGKWACSAPATSSWA